LSQTSKEVDVQAPLPLHKGTSSINPALALAQLPHPSATSGPRAPAEKTAPHYSNEAFPVPEQKCKAETVFTSHDIRSSEIS